MKDRPFEHWKIDRYHAKSPDGRYSFWIANGFMFFRDDEAREQLLSVISIWKRHQVWRALKKEIINRIDEIFS